MIPYKQHYFVCINERPPFAKQSCGMNNSHQVLEKLKEAVEKHQLMDEIRVTRCGCLGPCEEGPMIVVYPAGIWYRNVGPDDVEDIVRSHMLQNKPVARLVHSGPESLTAY